MSVYKEGYHAIELIQKQSKQIWPDACDFGAPSKKDDNIWQWAKQLANWYGIKSTRKLVDIKVCKNVEIYVSLMDETGRKSEKDATEYYRLAYFKTDNVPDGDGFFEIDKVTDSKKIAELTIAAEAQYAQA